MDRKISNHERERSNIFANSAKSLSFLHRFQRGRKSLPALPSKGRPKLALRNARSLSEQVKYSRSTSYARNRRKQSVFSLCPSDVFADLADGTETEETASEQRVHTPWTSIYVAAAIAFVQSFQFSIFVASMWNYISSVDPQVTEDSFGYLVGAYSLGQSISSPLFGLWSNTIGIIKIPLLTGLLCMVIGNSLYSVLYILPGNPLLWLIFARFVTGLGSGNSSLLRAYASTASASKDRSRAIALVTAGDTLGSTSGPLFQIIFLFLGENFTLLGFPLTMYNAPAIFSVVTDILGISIVSLWFVEDYAALDQEKEELGDLPRADIIAVIVCIITRFAQAFMMTNFEGTGNAYVSMMFNFNETETVRNNNYLYSAQAFIGFLVYFLFITCRLNRFIKLRVAIIGSVISFIVFHIVTFPFPFYTNKVTTFTDADPDEVVGCNSTRFSWCADLTTFSPLLYYFSSAIFISCFFPIFNISLTTLFSKIIGPRKQGTMQGIFQLAGALAKMTGPIAMSKSYALQGPRLSWLIQGIQMTIVLILWIVFLRKMIPLHKRMSNQKDGNDVKSEISSIEEDETQTTRNSVQKEQKHF